MHRTLRSIALASLLALSACIAPPRAYVARTDRVAVLGGGPAAQAELRGVMQRATLPKIGTIEITPAYVRYQHTHYGPFDAPLGPTWTHITWSQVDRVDLYPNHRAFVYESGAEKTWVQFGTPEDAERFADLVMSFKAWGAAAK